ncbi:hypothetical protein BD310DRAFT_641585 [Dichomitus squalens]|uniref:Uncharacterized protein n=1 Tax=Dichomitus squalens TaxID=114155 RepID=A0A4Q9PP14_9APHY|nr:hypothetical protein BD310DRAFT_641585 [Dichomitus squalens]
MDGSHEGGESNHRSPSTSEGAGTIQQFRLSSTNAIFPQDPLVGMPCFLMEALAREAAPSGSTVRQHRQAAPSGSTVRQHRQAAPSGSTIRQHHQAAPSGSTIRQHHQAAPIRQHHQAAPSGSTIRQHHQAAPSGSTIRQHRRQRAIRVLCATEQTVLLSLKSVSCA